MAINLANIFVIFITVHFTHHILIMVFSKKNRISTQQANTRLDELRAKPIKTLAEQKEFITIKRPKRIGTFRWRWSFIPKTILTLIIYMILFTVYRYIFGYFNINLVLWQAITYAIVFPLILNIALEKFKIQKSDVGVFFRRARGGNK